MSNENEADQRTQSGGVNTDAEGDLTVGRDIIGRDSITSTTTNVFNSDKRVTWGLLVLLGLVIAGVLGIILLLVPKLNAPLSASHDQFALTAQIWDIDQDEKHAIVASQQFNGSLSSNHLVTETVKQVGDWVIEQIGQRYELSSSEIQLHVHIPADLNTENMDIQVTPPGPFKEYVYSVEQGNKSRIPLDQQALAQYGKDLMLEISRPGYDFKIIPVKWGEALDEDYLLKPSKVRIGIEEFAGEKNLIAIGLMDYLAKNSRLLITDPHSLKALQDKIAQEKEAIARNPWIQEPIRTVLGMDFIISGGLELQ
jgi:hypothetical protein